MQLTILGCGTSTGVPIPGCSCAVCQSPHPRNKRSRTSAIIQADDGYSILIDTSIDLRTQALQHGVKRVDAVLYTHAHADHILGLDDLRAFNYVQRESIPCYGTKDTLEEIKRAFAYVFNPDPNHEGGQLPQLRLEDITHFTPLILNKIEVLPFLLWHGRMPVTGFRVGDLAYATDCKKIPDESKQVLKGIRFLILDGLRHEQHKTHFTIAEAVAQAKELGAEKTYLIHMTHTVDYEEESAKLPDGIEFAYDGLQITF